MKLGLNGKSTVEYSFSTVGVVHPLIFHFDEVAAVANLDSIMNFLLTLARKN